METLTILMSTYNGEKYLIEQLDSLLKQKDVKLNILVRDDGSTDQTVEILNKYQKNGKLKWYSGVNLKPANSFMNLIYNAPDSDYYAFCDQDDVWLDDKMLIAINKLKKIESDLPALYYGRPRLVDSNLNPIKNPKTSLHHMITYKEAIINSNATGCTMVFNRKLIDIVKMKQGMYVGMHDAWIHKVCIIFGGKLFFDNDVHILYRQHENNVIGINNSIKSKIKDKINSFKTKEKSRSRIIKSLYECYGKFMNEEDKILSQMVINYDKDIFNKLKLFFDFKIKTKYFCRNLFYKIAVLLNIF